MRNTRRLAIEMLAVSVEHGLLELVHLALLHPRRDGLVGERVGTDGGPRGGHEVGEETVIGTALEAVLALDGRQVESGGVDRAAVAGHCRAAARAMGA